MELPKGPEDIELRNIIDKLAQFVARNGPEFEQMTKNKQRDNPRFFFLFGGEFFNYYQYRVTTEQAIQRQLMMGSGPPPQQQMMGSGPPQQQMMGSGPPPQQQMMSSGPPQQMMVSGPPPQQQMMGSCPPQSQQMMGSGPPSQQMMGSGPPPPQQHNVWQNNGINSLDPNVMSQQINELQEQIRQSEANLSAQHQVLMAQKQVLIDDIIRQSQEEQMRRMAEDFNLNLNDFENILLPITDNCTKDSIANGKMWIFNHCNAPVHFEVIARYLLKRTLTNGTPFDARLHILYLINDLFNHCMRKGAESLKRSLEKVIVPVFCQTFVEADDERQQKLTKLLKLWEMNQYFESSALDQLQNPSMALANYKSALLNEFSGPISSVTNGQLAKYSQLQKQHSEFVAHIQTQIQQLQQKSQQMASNITQMPVVSLPMSVNTSMPGHPPRFLPSQNQTVLGSRPPLVPQFDQPPPPPTSVPMFLPLVHQTPPPGPPPQTSNANQSPLLLPQLQQSSQMGIRLGSVPQLPQQLVPPGNQAFPNPMTGAPPFPPTALPNHQFFNSTPIPPKEVIPDVPYFELPAGLMAPLVRLEDFEYKPIVPKDIRLPPPAPPNDRLLQAVEMFYAPPTHERPRNSDGWEQLGLYEFFKAKSQAKKIKEDLLPMKHSMDAFNRFCETNENITKNNSNNDSKLKQSSESEANTQSKHRSPSPKRRYREYREDRDERSPRRTKSIKSRSRSPSSARRRRSHSRSRSRSRSPIHSYRSRSRSRSRSPSPVQSFALYANPETRLDESNKGHQMLKKMGWSGASGLGVTEQGIQDPIKGGEVREADELYRGVGVKNSDNNNDPFEKFRKNKGQAFLQRIAQGRSDK